MSIGRQENKMHNHLEKNPCTMGFQGFKSTMAKLDAQLIREANERKARKEKKNG